MRKLLSVLLAFSVFLTGCAVRKTTEDDGVPSESNAIKVTGESTTVASSESSTDDTQPDELIPADYLDEQAIDLDFDSLSDPNLLDFLEGAIYCHLVDDLGKDMCIDNISAIYLSQEFIDELSYNSKSNIFFGYTLEELDEQFQGQSYLFTVENNETVVKARTPYDDTYDRFIQNIAIGTGVILICVTISIATYGGAPAVSAIFACAAKGGTAMAISSGTISGFATYLATGVSTGDWEKAKKEGLLKGSENFKVGAIVGSITAGAGEAIGLKYVTLSEGSQLTMNDVAVIQRETKLPLQVISKIKTMDQYEIFKNAKLTGNVVGGKIALIREIDLDYEYEGVKNIDRMLQGKAPLDPETNLPYELHHLAQESNEEAVLAILTRAEHRGEGNSKILHEWTKDSVVDRAEFASIRAKFWKDLVPVLQAM